MSIFSSSLNIGHLIQLVASDQDDPQKVLEKSFEWEHSRALELSKWLLALSSSVIVAIAASTLSKNLDLSQELYKVKVIYILIGLSILFAVSGVTSIWRSYVLHRRYVELSSLTARLVSIKPFLVRLKREGHI